MQSGPENGLAAGGLFLNWSPLAPVIGLQLLFRCGDSASFASGKLGCDLPEVKCLPAVFTTSRMKCFHVDQGLELTVGFRGVTGGEIQTRSFPSISLTLESSFMKKKFRIKWIWSNRYAKDAQ